jgi:DHA1 family inner membrane transport protein
VVIAAGHGYRAPSLVGAGLALAGLVVFVVALRAQRTELRRAMHSAPAAPAPR